MSLSLWSLITTFHSTDFNQIFVDASLEATSAAFVLFREAAEDSEPRQWVLVAWVPDMCRPKDKVPIFAFNLPTLQSKEDFHLRRCFILRRGKV